MHLCTVVPVSLSVGANRIVTGHGIPHPAGDPSLESREKEYALRKRLVTNALKALTTDITDQTVFSKD